MIYVHVPFCQRFCTYCDFYSEMAENPVVFERYVSGVCEEIRRRHDELAAADSFLLNTLYFGGGTPSLLPIDALGQILEALRRTGHSSPFAEFTMEANPEDIVQRGPDYLRELLRMGVNRLSIGIQSFDDAILRWMNRRHDAATAEKAVRMAREAGFGNISVDLIFGLSQLEDSVWKGTLDRTLALKPEHISSYQLSVEGESALAAMVAAGKYEEAGEEQCKRQYDILCQRLAAAGYHHYEISNFAKPGYEAKHNGGYWERIPYAGLGPGAHSLRFEGSTGIRSWNDCRLTDYRSTEERLGEEDARTETIMLSLRTAAGIDETWLRSHTDASTLTSLLAEGALVSAGGSRLRIPETRFFVSDEIIRELV